MRIGIDISQTAYEGTGVGNYLTQLVNHLLEIDKENEYVLFFSSLRRDFPFSNFHFPLNNKKVTVKRFKFPPTLLDLLWNRLHVMPIESLIGPVDIFISSDWTQPPAKKASMISIIYDFIVFKYPEETHNQTELRKKNLTVASNIVAIQKRRLRWVKKECQKIICISEATKQDAIEILGIEEEKLEVVYPGVTN